MKIAHIIDGDEEVRAELNRRIRQRWGASKRLADQIGVTPSILCRMAKGQTPVTDRVAQGVGFRRVVKFERVPVAAGEGE